MLVYFAPLVEVVQARRRGLGLLVYVASLVEVVQA
jgi:hypothetical protein